MSELKTFLVEGKPWGRWSFKCKALNTQDALRQARACGFTGEAKVKLVEVEPPCSQD